MDLQALYAPAARRLKPSIIRALLKLVQEPGVISLAGGTPDSALFDLERYAELAAKVTREEGRFSLQYGETQGWKALREQVALYMEGRGVKLAPEQVLITTGSQQGIDLLGRLFLAEGDSVAMEEPGYLGAIQSFKNFGASILPLPIDPERGLEPHEAEEALKAWRGPSPKLLYLTPSFQNPTGACLGEAQREALCELAARQGLLLVEDDPYGEISFDGPPPKPLKAYDRSGSCVFLGSFSKMSVPGLRLGWAAGPTELIRQMTLAKETADVCTGVLAQAIAAEFLKGGHLKATLPALVGAYRSRRDALHAALSRELPAGSRLTKARGGFFLWSRLPEGYDSRDLFEAAIAAKVAYVPGSAFYAAEGGGRRELRFSFCAAAEPQLIEGARRLGELLRRAPAASGEPRRQD